MAGRNGQQMFQETEETRAPFVRAISLGSNCLAAVWLQKKSWRKILDSAAGNLLVLIGGDLVLALGLSKGMVSLAQVMLGCASFDHGVSSIPSTSNMRSQIH